MQDRQRKRAKLSTFITVEIRGDGGAVLSQRVASDFKVQQLLESWAQYLERQNGNVAIDVQRIELRCNGRPLDGEERLYAVPGYEQGLIRLQASRKSPQEQISRKGPEFIYVVVVPLDGFAPLIVKAHRTVTVGRLQCVYAGRQGIKPESFDLLHNRRSVPAAVRVEQLLEGDAMEVYLEPRRVSYPDPWALSALSWALPWQPWQPGTI